MVQLNMIPVETDVLVLGGGLAGCMAAIRAGEVDGVRVTLVDKSNTLASGAAAAGIDHIWSYIPAIHQKMGYTLEDMAEDHRQGMAARFLRKDLFYLVAGTMYDRILDLERFGIQFRYEDSPVPGKFRIVSQFHSVPTSFNFDGAPLKLKLTQEAKRRGVNILNRIQVTDLVTVGGRIGGAIGVGTRTGDIYFFRAKTVVLASGRSNRLGRNLCGFDFNTRIPAPLSGDGISMAMRAGLPIINIEFLSGRSLAPCGNYNPNYGDPRNTVQPAARMIDEKGDVLIPRTQFFDWDKLGQERWTAEARKRMLDGRKNILEARRLMVKRHHEGGGPFYLDFSEASDQEVDYIEWSIRNEGKGTQFLRYFKEEEGADLRKNPQEYAGYWPRELSGNAGMGIWVDQNLETEITNLFGAGDVVGGFPWAAAPGAFTMGWSAGERAAKRAREEREFPPVTEEAAEARRRICSDILNRKRGFYWKEVETYAQNVLDFYCGDIRSETLLRRGLERLEEAKRAPLKAENPHELGRSLDVSSILDNSELVLRSSIERKESRPVPNGFRRAEYPEQDDTNWFCFLAIRKRDRGFEFSKIPIDP